MNQDTLVVSLLGGPGSGKSTFAAELFALLKKEQVEVELVGEYAKDKVWEESFTALDNQLYVFAKQYHRVWRLMGKVDVIVTDAALFNSLIYGTERTSQTFKQLVVEEATRPQTLNFFIKRKKVYNPNGREQTLEEARALDTKIHDTMRREGIGFEIIDGGNDAAYRMKARVLETIGRYATEPDPIFEPDGLLADAMEMAEGTYDMLLEHAPNADISETAYLMRELRERFHGLPD